MPSLLPTPWPADPVEGEVGHFDHTLWVKACLIALDNGTLRSPGTDVPAGKLLATTATDTWAAVDPTAVGGVPAGVIVMWSGTTAPDGWALCDGENGTPNLKNRFVLGWGTRVIGTVAGEENVTLTSNQSGVPNHTHTMQTANAPHSHSINRNWWYHNHYVNPNGNHAHNLDYQQDVALGSPNGKRVTGAGSINNANTTYNGNHDHWTNHAFGTANDMIASESANASHSHTINGNTTQNAAQAHNNMPPYYVLAYIIKL